MSWLGGTCIAATIQSSAYSLRYYSEAILGCLHRDLAISEWLDLKRGLPGPLERALAAFDLFILQDREGDIFQVSN